MFCHVVKVKRKFKCQSSDTRNKIHVGIDRIELETSQQQWPYGSS